MKKSIYILVLFLCSGIVRASNFEITPIMLNFKGVVVNDNVTIAYADFGSILISRDNDQNWEQKRVFLGGEILNIIFNNDEIVAFNDRGEIATSSDIGSNWSLEKKLDDSILAVIKYPDGYFIRMRHKLITLSNEFDQTKEFLIESKVLPKITLNYTPDYHKSILFANNELIAEFDSLTFLRFNINLEPIDTIKLLEKMDQSNYLGGYRLFYEENNIYFKYTFKENSKPKSSVYRTQDFQNIEKFADSQAPEDYYYINQGEYFSLTNLASNKRLTDTTKLSYIRINTLFKETTVTKGKQYIIGDRKIFEILDLKDSSLNVISDYSGFTVNSPERINDSSYIFYSSFPAIYKTENDGVTILPTIDKTEAKFQQGFKNYTIHFHYYDNENKILYLLVDPYTINKVVLLKSEDYGRTFDSVHTTHYWRINAPYSNAPNYMNASVIYNVQKRGDEFIFSDGHNAGPNGLIYTGIVTVKENGELVHYLMDSNKIFTNVYSKDTNTYLVHSVNTIDSTSEINFTSDVGKNWEIIHKYPINETVGDIYDIEVRGQQYWAITHYDFTNYPLAGDLFLDIIDKETNAFYRIASWVPPTENDPAFGIHWISVASDGDKAYISFQDTLFVTDDLFNKIGWDYYLFPNNGRVVIPFNKFGDRFFCRYVDDNNPYGFGMHWIKPLDSLISDVEEIDIPKASSSHFHIFPNPASNAINIQTNLELFEINIYNSLGIKVLSAENQKNIDISDFPAGVYICKIISGANIVTQKFVVIK